MIRIFRHYVPKSLLLLGIGEALILYFSLNLAASLRFLDEYVLLAPNPQSLLYAFVVMSAMTAMGLYWRGLPNGLLGLYLRLAVAFGVASLLLALLFFVQPDLLVGRGVFGLGLVISVVGIGTVRWLYYHYVRHDALMRYVLVVGAGQRANQLEALCHDGREHGFILVGYVHVPDQPDVVPERKILDRKQSIDVLVERYQVDEIVVAIDDRRKGFPVDAILECKMNGIQVSDLVDFFERETRKIQLEALHPSSLIFSDGFSHAVLSNYGKRAFDVCASLILLAFAWPVMIVTAISIWLESGGPVLYRQERVGRNGKVFKLLKFRSMRVDAEACGKAQWAQQNDPRVTKNGRIIRALRIDELPQLVNVLRGDMSIVGPRPERPQFVEQLEKQLPFYGLRHKVNPGITGWAQISYPYGSTVADALEKLQYDLYYVKNSSLLFDLMILFQTAHTVLWGRGAR